MPTLRQMSITPRVTVGLGWLVLAPLGLLGDHCAEHWIIVTAVLIVMAVAALVFWWRWEQEIK